MADLSRMVRFSHVGLGKTGSTYLQRHYFSKLPVRFFSTEQPFEWPTSLTFVGEGNSLWYPDLISGGSFLTPPERRTRYREEVGARLQKWRQSVSNFAASEAGRGAWILSAEGLCGVSAEINDVHMQLLKTAHVEKVFFMCRQQGVWAKSLWRQFLLAEDRFARFVSFDEIFGTSDREGVVDLDWNKYIQGMDAEFGAENVLVLPYELLVADSVDFFRRLNTFIGFSKDTFIPDCISRENQSREDSVYNALIFDRTFPFDRLPRIRRRLHRLSTRHQWLFPEFLKQAHSMAVSNETLDALLHRLHGANVRLEARVAISLGQYGYF